LIEVELNCVCVCGKTSTTKDDCTEFYWKSKHTVTKFPNRQYSRLHFVDPVIPKERCDQYVGPRFSWRGCQNGESL